MTSSARSRPFLCFLGLIVVACLVEHLPRVLGEGEAEPVPSEVQCRPYIEKALKDLEAGPHEDETGADHRSTEDDSGQDDDDQRVAESQENEQGEDDDGTEEQGAGSNEESGEADSAVEDNDAVSAEDGEVTDEGTEDDTKEDSAAEEEDNQDEGETSDSREANDGEDETPESNEDENVETVEEEAVEDSGQEDSVEQDEASAEKETEGSEEAEGEASLEEDGVETQTDEKDGESEEQTSQEGKEDSGEDSGQGDEESTDVGEDANDDDDSKAGDNESEEGDATVELESAEDDEKAEENDDKTEEGDSEEATLTNDGDEDKEGTNEEESKEAGEAEESTDSGEEQAESEKEASSETVEDAASEETEVEEASKEAETSQEVSQEGEENQEESVEVEETVASRKRRETGEESTVDGSEETGDKEESGEEEKSDDGDSTEDGEEESGEAARTPEEDLIEEIEIPENLRPRDHINQLLRLDVENEAKERAIQKSAEIILKDLKKLYDTAIQPLETLYKYRDLSNRHFGDPEIFSKPLILFMGPWSGGKSTLINYLLDIEYTPHALRTGAEPSPAYFNIVMHGEETEILDGTQLAADWTFSGLQKFGQGMLDRLRGLKVNNKLLERVNIVEIPGILEIRKQVQRSFPFNDACQWFIDRADIIFLVYDPSKLDVGPETEAILDQLKGREYQTRIILNKADQVKPEELMRVQGALIWNISPLMSSAEPPIMFSTSLWSMPYEAGAPTRLLYAQERAFLRDLRSAVDKRVEHKIASARRFAVRVRNHAKMVDCYLTTYYNHKTFFGNKKETSEKIVENPQDYHIYEGLSTLTNISRYDLPDPDVYRDFFRLNALYDFQSLSSTCTYFRGCPINRLDVAIAYDLPELVGKYKKSVELAMHEAEPNDQPDAS